MYTNLKLKFTPAIIVEGQDQPVESKYLVVHIRDTNSSIIPYSFPTKVKVIIPSTGLVKLKLLPSSGDPKLRYTVEYYTGKSKVSLLTQQWIIPKPIENYTFSTSEEVCNLPKNTYDVVSVLPENSEYTIKTVNDQEVITFIDGILNHTITVSLSYTLIDILEN
jgi:hypothetical protein